MKLWQAGLQTMGVGGLLLHKVAPVPAGGQEAAATPASQLSPPLEDTREGQLWECLGHTPTFICRKSCLVPSFVGEAAECDSGYLLAASFSCIPPSDAGAAVRGGGRRASGRLP